MSDRKNENIDYSKNWFHAILNFCICILISTCVIFALIFFMFLLAPTTANVTASIESDLCDTELRSEGQLECSIVSGQLCMSSDEGLLFINDDGYTVDDKGYSGEFVLYVEAADVEISTTGYTKEMRVETLEYDDDGSTAAKQTTMKLNGDSPRLDIEGQKIRLYDENYSKPAQQYAYFLKFRNADAAAKIFLTDGEEEILLDLDSEVYIKELDMISLTNNESGNMSLDMYVNSGRISLGGITNAMLNGTGSVIFSYTATPHEYYPVMQDIHFHNVKGKKKLDSDVILSDRKIDKITIHGAVSESEISGQNLFPSFRGWYFDNLYLAPITLISVIISAGNLMGKQRRFL